MAKEVLITGSQSYIGSVLAPYLENKGYSVTGIDSGFIKECTLYPHSDPPTTYKDVRDISEDDLRGVRTVVHLAGISNDPFLNLDARKIYDPTREYTLQIARMCKTASIKFIFPSSCSVYGKSEDYVNEYSPTNPLTPYSMNKVEIEKGLEEITDKKFTPIILRLATATGLSPRMRFDLAVNSFTGIAFTKKEITLNSDGKAWRPYVDVSDICKSVASSIEYNPYPGEKIVLNVGSTSQNFQVLTLVEMIKVQLPNTMITPFTKTAIQINTGLLNTYIQDGIDKRDYKVRFERIKQEFNGFECDYTVAKSIKAMLEKFSKINLTEEQFRNKNFYRLKQLEWLIKNNYLTDDLRWSL